MPHLSPDKRLQLNDIIESTGELDQLSLRLKELRDSDSLVTLRQKTDDLHRKIREFDSDLFIIVTLGMLKAGKSSLVNLLARSPLASPTGYGYDTTLRPALIVQAPEDAPKEGRIIVWFAREKEDFTEALDDVIDHIRGISPEVTRATHVIHELTQENLNVLLCQTCAQAGNMLYQEPVLVVVQTPRAPDSLLSDNVALLDTPGLDSSTSTWTRDSHWYEWIINRCDLLLFLQSSVAPLNEKANSVLRNILDKNRKASIWLIQNQMEAKFWYAPEVIREDNEKQASHAARLFRQVAPDFTARMLRSNLGKAYTALLENAPELTDTLRDESGTPHLDVLRTQSDFDVLQSHLSRELEENADAARLKNCVGDLLNATRDLWTQWKAHIEHLDRAKKELEEKAGRIDWEKESYIRQLSAIQSPLFRADDLEILLPWPAFREKLQNRFHSAFTEESISAERINDFIDEMKDLASQTCRSASECLRPEFLMIRRSGTSQSVKSCIEQNVDEFLDNTFTQFTSGRDILMPLNTLSRGDIPHVLVSGYCPGALLDGFFPHLTKEKHYLFWEKKPSKREAEAFLLSSPDSLMSKLEAYFRDEQNTLAVQITDWAEEQRRALIQDYKEKTAGLAERMKGDIREQQKSLDADRELGTEAEQACNAISNLATRLN